MSTSKYHHGDLKNVLLAAAERMIDADVRREFSLRELAREAQVSHAAPYKHFPDRGHLVRELAERWMTGFVDAQQRVVAGSDVRVDLVAVGTAYVEWAAAHPSRFTVIFDPAINTGPGPEGFGAQVARHTELLADLVDRARAERVLTATPELEAGHLWAVAHGVATLVTLRRLPLEAAPAILEHALAPR